MARPKEFDPDEALDRAIQVFWQKGYDGTSIQDLVDRTGVNRFSLYKTFGDKRSLFLAACDRYRNVIVARHIDTLERSDAGLGAIRGFFGGLLDLLTEQGRRWGCLMTNSVVEVAPHDEETAERGRAHLARLTDAFHAALVRARDQGEIAPGHDLRDDARYLTTGAQGLAVVAKVSTDTRALQGVVRTMLSSLG